VPARNAAKQKIRELIRQVRRDVIANAGCGPQQSKLVFEAGGVGSEARYHRAELPVPDPEAPGGVTLVRCDLYEGRISTMSQLQAIQDDLKGRLDSLSEMGEMESLRLQMAMDRMSKMMSTLSNLLKKISDTQESITQNLK